MKKLAKYSVLTVFAALSAVILTSCTNEVENKGYITKNSDFTKIKPGVSTKADVMHDLGSPTTTSMFGEDTWFYIGQEQTKETFFEPELKQYDAYAITFNNSGVVKAIDKKDKDAMKEVEVAEDFTKTSGNEITVIQQLFGNLGKFNPASRMGGNSIRSGTTPGARGY